MKTATTIQITMPNYGGVVVALRNRRGYWFSFIKRTTGQQEETI